MTGFLRERLVLDGGSLWAGGSAGHTLRDGNSWHSTDFDLGASLRAGGFEASLSYERQRTDDWPLMEAAGIFLSDESAANDFQDAILAARYQRGRFTLQASHSWRSGLRQTTARQTAFIWSAEYEMTPRLSLAVGAGHQLADPVRGTPDVQLVSMTVHVTVLPWRPVVPAVGTAAASARIVPAADGAVLIIHVVAADSARVEVAGSFSAWQPVTLRRTPDGWEAQVSLRPGTHRVAVRINGGPWRAPSNLGKLRDEFGGESGIVVIP